jgi:hypothetical protein
MPGMRSTAGPGTRRAVPSSYPPASRTSSTTAFTPTQSRAPSSKTSVRPTTAQLTISSSQTSPPDTPCLQGQPGYATMPTRRTSAPVMTCTAAETSEYSTGRHVADVLGVRRLGGEVPVEQSGTCWSEGSGVVVRTFLRSRIPARPRSAITRATRLRLTRWWAGAPSLSSAVTRGPQ